MDSRLLLPVDTNLVGSYRIMRVVGAGGFGITYEAEDFNLGALVAIKEYYPVEFGDRDATMNVRPKSERHKEAFEMGRANFLKEARTLARFEHPSIVRVTRVFEANSTAYMVMRFEHGLSLEAWLKALHRPPKQEELDFVAAPLLDALELMHSANFLHGDIAPDNILIRADGTPVLLDFGAARRAVAEMSRTVTDIVKAGYSPHEQYSSDGRHRGPWSDIYALGATLYRAVTGKLPEEATLRFYEDRLPPAVQAATGTYRRDFLAAIDASLKVRYTERPQSVAQLRPMLLGGKSQPTRRGSIIADAARTRAQQATPAAWQPPAQSGMPGKPLGVADMRQWQRVLGAVQSDNLAPHGGGEPATSMMRRPPPRATTATAPAASPRAAKALAASSVRRFLPALMLGAVGLLLGIGLLSRSVRDALGELLAIIGFKPKVIHFISFFAGRRAAPLRDFVDCTVFSPPAAQPGSTVLVQAFLHVRSDAGRVSVLASMMDTATALKSVQTLQVEIPRGARIDLALSGAGLQIEEPMQSLVWQGEPTFAQFLVTLPRDAAQQSYHPVLRVLLEGKLAGRVVFRLTADPNVATTSSLPSGERAGRYGHAFVSYASEDRQEVLKRVQMLDATRTAFFQDILSLDPGARWEQELYKRIDECDLFLLFWSNAAKQSEWVIKEAEYALARQADDPMGEPDIVPVILEGPPPVLPPDSLRHLHFDDRIRYFIAAG